MAATAVKIDGTATRKRQAKHTVVAVSVGRAGDEQSVRTGGEHDSLSTGSAAVAEERVRRRRRRRRSRTLAPTEPTRPPRPLSGYRGYRPRRPGAPMIAVATGNATMFPFRRRRRRIDWPAGRKTTERYRTITLLHYIFYIVLFDSAVRRALCAFVAKNEIPNRIFHPLGGTFSRH